jgi:hypothetical protein
MPACLASRMLRRARFTPMDFVLPPLLWLGVGKRSLPFRILNWAIVVGYSGIAIAGARPTRRAACVAAGPPLMLGSPAAASRSARGGRSSPGGTLGFRDVHAVLWAQRTAHAPHQRCCVMCFLSALASAVSWRACAGAAEQGRRGGAAQALSGPSRRSTPTWPTTASLLTCSRPTSGPVSTPAAACRAGAESLAGLGGARCALVGCCPLRMAWCLCPLLRCLPVSEGIAVGKFFFAQCAPWRRCPVVTLWLVETLQGSALPLIAWFGVHGTLCRALTPCLCQSAEQCDSARQARCCVYAHQPTLDLFLPTILLGVGVYNGLRLRSCDLITVRAGARWPGRPLT